MRRLGAVGIVIVGLLAIAGTLPVIGSVFAAVRSGVEDGSFDRLAVAFSIGGIVLTLAFAVGLIMGRNRLSRRWFDETETGIAVDAPDLLRIGLVLIGVGIMLSGARSAVVSVSNGSVQALSMSALADSSVDNVIALWSVVLFGGVFGLAQVLVGWLLIRFSQRLATFIWSLPRMREPRPELVPVATCPACGYGYDPADYREGTERRCVQCHTLLDDGPDEPAIIAIDDGSGFDASD